MARLWASMKEAAGRDDVPYPEHNPLTKSGQRVLDSMTKGYGVKKAKKVFYSSINAKKAGSSKWHGK